ncbi:MAG: saccharopine dehydrogenase NADP-binding domain-containing protein [bacterium]|jgi:lysine 6-dehydrogenase|nr:saccharopine dehydrogenase NADP-binding domain-containing protein [bacterium]
MKYLLLGAGLQGTAIAHDLLRHAEGTTGLVAVDSDADSLERLAARFGDARFRVAPGYVQDQAFLAPLMKEADVVISAVNYWYNAPLAAQAIGQRAHFLDLGGNNDVVAREFALDAAARDAGVAIVPDCGLAPGLAGILGYWLTTRLAKTASLRLRVGGLPLQPRPPMNYKIVFSVEGLINEYIEPAVVIRGGRLDTVPSLTELETLTFPEPFGELEAFQTSGGTSTLPQTLAGRVPELDYKTIRYKGHCAQFRLLRELGLTDDRPLAFPGGEVSPRQMLANRLKNALEMPGPDAVLVLVVAEGWDAAGEPKRLAVRIIDRHDDATGLSAMMRMTGFPAAIIARMLASGTLDAVGACCQELIVPGQDMAAELRRRGIDLVETESRPDEPLPVA